MEMEQVNALCEELVKAVTVMMDPSSTQRYRLEALKFCEEFKEKCPICVPCGLKLAEKTQIAIVRHFGLQILEHVVKFRWNSMSRLEKVYLKNSVMELIANGTLSILEEENHIKDVLSRIVVEMIKREWPQHWPDMLMELDTLSRQGETQRELVMFILLRLAEDVVTFQTLPTQRRRDIQQTLTQNMERILNFLLSTLQENVNKYQQMKTDASQEAEAQANCRVSIAALNTLAGYIDWVSLNHITAENCKLVETLCLLLNEQELQLGAAECLLIAVSRKVSKLCSSAQSTCEEKDECMVAAGVLTGTGSEGSRSWESLYILESPPPPYLIHCTSEDSTPSPRSATNWEPRVQIPARIESILIQTTAY